MRSRHTRPLNFAALAGVVLALSACASSPPPQIPVHASEVYMERLAGTWSGSYWSADTGRRGRISFELEVAEGIAHGEVIMIPASGRDLSPAYEDWQVHDRPATPTPLHIEIVRAADNQVSGTLEPYRDPDCDCLLATSFIGTLRDGVIEGSFVSLGGPGHRKQAGSWRVERRETSTD